MEIKETIELRTIIPYLRIPSRDCWKCMKCGILLSNCKTTAFKKHAEKHAKCYSVHLITAHNL